MALKKRVCKQTNLEAQGLSFPKARSPHLPSAGQVPWACPEGTGFEAALSTLLTQGCTHPGLWIPQLLAPFTLKRGVRTTAPALPNSKAVSSWGSTLCRQKSSGNESRLLLSSWKNFCFSAGSLIWGSTDRADGGTATSCTLQIWMRAGITPV